MSNSVAYLGIFVKLSLSSFTNWCTIIECKRKIIVVSFLFVWLWCFGTERIYLLCWKFGYNIHVFINIITSMYFVLFLFIYNKFKNIIISNKFILIKCFKCYLLILLWLLIFLIHIYLYFIFLVAKIIVKLKDDVVTRWQPI